MTAVEEKFRASIDVSLAPRIEQQKTYVAYGEAQFALEGAGLLYLRDQYHQQFLDFSSGGGMSPVGHGHDGVRARIAEQLAHYGYVGRPQTYVQRWPVEYAKALSESLPTTGISPLQVLFTTDQDSAMSLACTIAQQVTQRQFLSRKPDWALGHRDTAALIITVIDRFNRLADPAEVIEGTVRARNDGAVIIADERRSGFGITGRLWGQERWDYDADITVIGGPGGGGFPFGAVVAPQSYFQTASDFVERQATAGHPAVCAAGLTTLQAIDPPLLAHVTDCFGVINDGIEELVEQFPQIKSHSGVGLIHHLQFESHFHARKFAQGCLDHHLVVGRVLDGTVELTPPLIASELEIRRGVDLMGYALLDWVE